MTHSLSLSLSLENQKSVVSGLKYRHPMDPWTQDQVDISLYSCFLLL